MEENVSAEEQILPTDNLIFSQGGQYAAYTS